MFTLAHLSDLHATPVHVRRWQALSAKQALGWIKWFVQRRKEHRPEVLDALVTDLQQQRPDHIVVTGDLTNLGLEEEFSAAMPWLQQLGDGQKVSIVPGNHEAYVPIARSSLWSCWAEYLASDEPTHAGTGSLHAGGEAGACDFPSVRIRDWVAFVGVSSAQPSGLLHANGQVGQLQLERLEKVLTSLAGAALCRIVLIHHPPTDTDLSRRRRLTDAAALRDLLKRVGADLVLHGHTHQTAIAALPGPESTIPVIGVRSASAVGHRPERHAQYHLYRIARQASGSEPGRFRITLVTRSYDVRNRRVQSIGERIL
jgi:3',5'-cyclic AMP phosphodiesterase CpdA